MPDTQDTSVQQSIDTQPDTVRVAVTIPRELDRAMEFEAVRRDVTKGAIYAEALAAYLAERAA